MTGRRVSQQEGSLHTDRAVCARVEVTHDIGLHARPSVAFTRLAKSFPCTIGVEVNDGGVWLNGKSIVKIMGARIRKGFVLSIKADGAGADEAVRALCALVERNFDEEKPHARSA
ncbi:HPr family phosphocarrier protein [Mycoplana rhizolycopersici]|uniref:Phosphocarrier protein HPr n=1 Tax=Mycoplana rhizolycopersici TaxID=2746702 RepID=A0ABX2QBK5_9HYPH|nr:HPr family phosphocarrier protein [Rhizobium rhizolycopersici]NVP55120.1 HPr family phosphocarrier protein [Rhizobium rhizolycopersici]